MFEPDYGATNGVEGGYCSGSGSTANPAVGPIKRTRSGRISIDVPPQLLTASSSGMTTPMSGEESVGLLSGEVGSGTPSLNGHMATGRLRTAGMNSLRSRRQIGRALFCAGGIYVCYIYYGLLQERLYSKTYVNEKGKKEMFQFSLLLIFVQCIFNVLFAIAWSLTSRAASAVSGPSNPPLCGPLQFYAFGEFSGTSFSYVSAIICSNVALHYVNYPTQVLGKSCKMIPVMIFGVLFGSAKYTILEYVWVLMVTCGIVFFMMANKQVEVVELDEFVGSGIIGPGLLVASLLLDGVTGASQDWLVVKHQPTSMELMMFQNIWGTILCFAGLLVSGEGVRGYSFLKRHRSAVFDLGAFAVCSATGQFFIFLCIRNFGSLFCTTITTTRKFFTILASVLWFQHAMNIMHWLGVAMVFVGLFGKIYVSSMTGLKQKKGDGDSKVSDWDSSSRDMTPLGQVGPTRNGRRNGYPSPPSISGRWPGR